MAARMTNPRDATDVTLAYRWRICDNTTKPYVKFCKDISTEKRLTRRNSFRPKMTLHYATPASCGTVPCEMRLRIIQINAFLGNLLRGNGLPVTSSSLEAFHPWDCELK